MPRMRSRLKSEIPNTTTFTDVLTKIAALYVQRPSRLKFEVGTARFNATEATDVTFDPTLGTNPISFQRPNSDLTGSGKEESQVTCIADDGAFEISSVTTLADDGALEVTDVTLVADVAGSLNNKYFTFEDPAGTHKFYVWYNINSAGTDPALAGRTGIEVDGATGASASTLGGATRTALSAASTYFTVSGATTHAILTSKTLGNAVNSADGAAPTGFTFTLTQGHAATRQSTYFNFSDALDAHKYYCWLNVNGEGVDPTVATRTGVPITVAAGDSANTIATAIRAAVAALGASAYFTTAGSNAVVTITNKKMGNSTNTADGVAPTGFTISTTQSGHASALNSKYFTIHSAADATAYYVWMNVNSEGVDPAPGGTGIAVAFAAGATAATIAIAAAAAIDAQADFVAAIPTTAAFTFHNNTAGAATDVAEGAAATGFTFSVLGQLESYELTDIVLIKRLRNKKWLIKLNESSDPAAV